MSQSGKQPSRKRRTKPPAEQPGTPPPEPAEDVESEKADEPEDVVDEASEESFPASDSPSWTPIRHVGRRQRGQRP